MLHLCVIVIVSSGWLCLYLWILVEWIGNTWFLLVWVISEGLFEDAMTLCGSAMRPLETLSLEALVLFTWKRTHIPLGSLSP